MAIKIIDVLTYSEAIKKYPGDTPVAISIPWAGNPKEFYDDSSSRFTGEDINEAWITFLNYGKNKWANKVMVHVIQTKTQEEIEAEVATMSPSQALTYILDSSPKDQSQKVIEAIKSVMDNRVNPTIGRIPGSDAAFLCLMHNDIFMAAMPEQADRTRFLNLAMSAATRLNSMFTKSAENQKVANIVTNGFGW